MDRVRARARLFCGYGRSGHLVVAWMDPAVYNYITSYGDLRIYASFALQYYSQY